MGSGHTANERGTRATPTGPKPAVLHGLQMLRLPCKTISSGAMVGIPTRKKQGGKHKRGTRSNFTGSVSALWRLQPYLFASPPKTC